MEWGKRLRPLFCLTVLLASGCSASTPEADAPVTVTGTCTKNCALASPTGSARSSPATHPTNDAGTAGYRFDYSPPKSDPDHGNIGDLARTYLRASPAKLYVEIAYSRGDAPAAAVRDHLAAILRRETRKEVVVALGDEVPDQSRYTLAHVVALSKEHRRHHTSDTEATAWIAWLSGRLADGQGVLGVAYNSSEAVVFPDQIATAATAIVRSHEIERAVLVHEFGHLLGLVNIAATSRYDHEDPDHPGHSRYDASVMYWAIDDISVSALLSGGPPDDFDRYDRADLSALRAA